MSCKGCLNYDKCNGDCDENEVLDEEELEEFDTSKETDLMISNPCEMFN